MKTYEAMFLMDPALAVDLPAAEAEIRRILDRAEAEVLGLVKWDERRLAYPIRKHKRGLYMLSYFKAAHDRIVDIDRDVRLSETVIRALVLAKEAITAEDIDKALAAAPAAGKPVRTEEPDGRSRRPDRPDQKPDKSDKSDVAAPKQEAPAGDAVKAKDASAKDTSTKDAPTEDAPTKEAAAKDAPAKDPESKDATLATASLVEAPSSGDEKSE